MAGKSPKAETKKCNACNEVKQVSEFYKRSDRRGLTSECKICNIARTRNWQIAHPEQKRESAINWVKNNHEKALALWARSRKNNATNRAISRAKWALANPDKEKKYRRTAYENNEEQRRIYRAHRRALVAGAIGNGWITQEFNQLKEDYCYRCAYCGKKTEKLTPDHIVPLSRGGRNDINNIVPACRSCNSSKGAASLLVWMYKQRAKVSYSAEVNNGPYK